MKRLLAFLLVSVMVLSMAACGGSAKTGTGNAASSESADSASTAAEEPKDDKDSSADNSQKPVHLKFLSHTFKPWNDVLTKQAEEFQKENPNVKIEYTTVEHKDLNTKLMTSLASGTAPHVMGVYGPWMEGLVKNKWIAAAPPYVEEDIKNNTVEVAGQSATYEGKIYGYIQHIGIPTPIINERIYQDAGLQIPTTYEELLAVNEKLDKKDGNDKFSQVGTALAPKKDGSWNVIHWSTILKAYGGNIISEDGKKAAFNTPEGLEATKIYAKLTHANFIENSFTLEKAAMEWQGPWTKSFYEQNNPKLQFKAIAPLKGPSKQVTTMYAWFWTVNANVPAEEQDWAWKFNMYISNDKNYLDLCKQIGFISFRKANLEDSSYVNDPWIKAFGDALQNSEIYYDKIPNWEKIDVAIGEELERMNVNEQTPEKALSNAEKKVNEILAEE